MVFMCALSSSTTFRLWCHRLHSSSPCRFVYFLLPPFLRLIFRPFSCYKNSRAGVSTFTALKNQFSTHYYIFVTPEIVHHQVSDHFLAGLLNYTVVRVLCRLYFDDPWSTTHTGRPATSPLTACLFCLINLD